MSFWLWYAVPFLVPRATLSPSAQSGPGYGAAVIKYISPSMVVWWPDLAKEHAARNQEADFSAID